MRWKYAKAAGIGIVLIAIVAVPVKANPNEQENCVDVPGSYAGITILERYRIPELRALRVCVGADVVVAGVVPLVRLHPGCGSGCFTVEVEATNVNEKAWVRFSYEEDRTPKELRFELSQVQYGENTGDRRCVIAYGTPDPCATVSAPTLSATAGTGEVSLNWTAAGKRAGAPVAGYDVYRSTDAGATWHHLVRVGSDRLSHVDSGLPSESSFGYFVVAFDRRDNRSSSSNVVWAEAS